MPALELTTDWTPSPVDPDAQTTAAATHEDRPDGPTFADVLDIINPLHHIPLIGGIYRAISGDAIAPTARMPLRRHRGTGRCRAERHDGRIHRARHRRPRHGAIQRRRPAISPLSPRRTPRGRRRGKRRQRLIDIICQSARHLVCRPGGRPGKPQNGDLGRALIPTCGDRDSDAIDRPNHHCPA